MTNNETISEIFGQQIGLVMEAIQRDPGRTNRILAVFVSNFFNAVKETIRLQGHVPAFYIMLTDPVVYGVPPVTDEVLQRAKGAGAAAVVSLEGFQSTRDIGDVIYHVSLSAPVLGVAGWVLKVKLEDRKVLFVREMPYFYDTREKIKTLGELIAEMEGE